VTQYIYLKLNEMGGIVRLGVFFALWSEGSHLPVPVASNICLRVRNSYHAYDDVLSNYRARCQESRE
jgi:hypothetical protein